jgi:hypothetical protein
MIVDAPWYVPNTVIRRDLQIPIVKAEMRRYSSQYSVRLSAHPNASSKPHGATRQQAIAKAPPKWSAYQIPSIIVVLVFVILVFKVQFVMFYSQKPQEALNLLVTEECYWTHFYMPLYTFFYTICSTYLHRLQIKWNFQKKRVGVHDKIWKPINYVDSRSHITTDGQSASCSSWCLAPFGAYCIWITITFFVFHVWRPLWREDGSVICSAMTQVQF